MNSGRYGQPGFSLIEVLITVIVISVGLLGLASLQTKAQVAELEAYQRAQALLLLTDMVDTLHANRLTANCFRITTVQATGTPYIGVGYDGTPVCTSSTSSYNAQAVQALQRLDNLLDGAAETITSGGSTTELGAMVGARACVSYDASSELTNADGAVLPGTGEYVVAVVWQGMLDLFDLSDAGAEAAINCAKNEYGNVKRRRMVSMKVRLADLD